MDEQENMATNNNELQEQEAKNPSQNRRKKLWIFLGIIAAWKNLSTYRT